MQMTHSFERPAPLEYPSWLEDWWMNFLSTQMGGRDPLDCIEALKPQVQQLSDRFIADERGQILRGYGDETPSLLAYAIFFFAQTFTRVQVPLAEAHLFRGWQCPHDRPLRLLDLGAGLGAASLGWLYWWLQTHPQTRVEIDALEISQKSLQWYRALVDELQEHWPHCKWRMHRGDLKSPWKVLQTDSHTTWDILLASFSLNEAFEDAPHEQVWGWLEECMQRLAPEGLLMLLEPASQKACERLEWLRDRVASRGQWQIWGPCLHHQNCPLLQLSQQNSKQEHWCHEVQSWQIPPSLQWLNRHMYRAISSLKYGHLILGHQPPTNALSPNTFRMISPMAAQKGRHLAVGCANDGNRLAIEIQTRDLDAEGKSLIKQLQRGDIVQLHTQAPLAAHPTTGLHRLPPKTRMVRLFPK